MMSSTASKLVLIMIIIFMALSFLLLMRGKHSPTQPTISVQRANIPAPAPDKPPLPTIDAFAVPVLMYHRVCDLTPKEARSPLMRDLTVSPHNFEMQMRYLVENGFHFLFARDVEKAVREHGKLPEKGLAITFDDGYKDNFEQAFPVLLKYHIPATEFLVTSTVNTNGHLSWNDVFTMQEKLIGYGSHTVTHRDLTTLSLTEMDKELRDSKQVLEAKLLDVITAVAYPAGSYNKIVASRAEAAGYLAGWKKGGGPVQPGARMFMLPRVRVNGQMPIEEFKRTVWSGVWISRINAEKQGIKLEYKPLEAACIKE